ncbi:MAG: outer membrane lipoprotein LolB [Candidatus Obscuribacterales bacterium]|nr:outer membrane lipoprotein LolB [Steroidobacteraceae bacterium]
MIRNRSEHFAAGAGGRFFIVVALALLLTFLTGCAVAPKEVSPSRDASSLLYWQVSGRIAVSGADGGGSGSFTWMQNNEQAVVQLRGPLGVGSLRLTLDNALLRIETGDGQLLEAAAAEVELSNRLGAAIPTRELRYWLRGLSGSGAHEWIQLPTSTSDAATLSQNDWRIDYQRYGITDGVRLPLKWVATNGPAKVRVVIDSWRLQ